MLILSGLPAAPFIRRHAQMLTCMDDLASPPDWPEGLPQQQDGQGGGGGGEDEEGEERPVRAAPRPHVVVIGATNRPDAIDPALRSGSGAYGLGGAGRGEVGVQAASARHQPLSLLGPPPASPRPTAPMRCPCRCASCRRAGRFDREIALGIPTEAARVTILQVGLGCWVGASGGQGRTTGTRRRCTVGARCGWTGRAGWAREAHAHSFAPLRRQAAVRQGRRAGGHHHHASDIWGSRNLPCLHSAVCPSCHTPAPAHPCTQTPPPLPHPLHCTPRPGPGPAAAAGGQL